MESLGVSKSAILQIIQLSEGKQKHVKPFSKHYISESIEANTVTFYQILFIALEFQNYRFNANIDSLGVRQNSKLDIFLKNSDFEEFLKSSSLRNAKNSK